MIYIFDSLKSPVLEGVTGCFDWELFLALDDEREDIFAAGWREFPFNAKLKPSFERKAMINSMRKISLKIILFSFLFHHNSIS